jgi:hypothetical protein
LRYIEGKHGAAFGQEIMQSGTQEAIKEVTYWWPRPGSDMPLQKTTFYTKAGDQICAVGYYSAWEGKRRNAHVCARYGNRYFRCTVPSEVRYWHLADIDADADHVRFRR